MLNIEVPREDGPPFIAELQVALSGIAILKKSEQAVYTIMRMQHAADLQDTFVFDTLQDRVADPTWSTALDAESDNEECLSDFIAEVASV